MGVILSLPTQLELWEDAPEDHWQCWTWGQVSRGVSPAQKGQELIFSKRKSIVTSQLPSCRRDNSCQSATFYSDGIKIEHDFQAAAAHPVVVMSS